MASYPHPERKEIELNCSRARLLVTSQPRSDESDHEQYDKYCYYKLNGSECESSYPGQSEQVRNNCDYQKNNRPIDQSAAPRHNYTSTIKFVKPYISIALSLFCESAHPRSKDLLQQFTTQAVRRS
jgi:hypothetical protein